ncbi:MAG: thiol:disulfide interchange protein DsbA/DsbL [Betaproteobacteria bacterium]
MKAYAFSLAILCAVLTAAPFAEATEPMEDVDYVRIDPQPAPLDKVEVIEFFFYGCESCNRLEPALQSWLKTIPADVSFRRIPAIRRSAWVPLTRLYFSLERLGEIERLHSQVYRVVQEEGVNFVSLSSRDQWADKVGIDRDKLARLLDSDEVNSQVQRAHDLTVAYGVRATPTLVVDGRYLTSGGVVGSVDGLLAVVDGLIEKARATRASK